MLKFLYCNYCRIKTLHSVNEKSEATCYTCVQRAMEEEAKYLDNLRTAQGADYEEDACQCEQCQAHRREK